MLAIILFKQQKQTTQRLFIRWYFQFILRIYPVTMLSGKLCNSNYTHSDSFSYLDKYIRGYIPSYKESPICLILLPELDRCNDQTFVSFLITVWKTAAKDRSLACFACTRILLLFLKVFSPFFPILQLLWLDTLIK